MEWSREKCLQLIDEYEKHPVLWNPKHGCYYNKVKKCDAWVSIEENMGCSSGEAKKKMESILASFRREKAKGTKPVGAGKGRHQIYMSKWFAFSRMMFLLNRDDPRSTIDSVEEDTLPDNEPESLFEDKEDAANAQQEAGTSSQSRENNKIAIETSQTFAASTSARTQKTSKRKRPIRPSRPAEDTVVQEALDILKSAVVSNSLKSDECGIYGQHVAHKLRSYTKKTRNIVQHHINTLLFNADMGQYDIVESRCFSTSNLSVSMLSPHPSTGFSGKSSPFSTTQSVNQSREHTPVPTLSPKSETILPN